MRAKKFVCCLLAMMLLAGVSFISCGNSSKAKADSELTTQDGEDFKYFQCSLPVYSYQVPIKDSDHFVGR